MKAIHRHPHRWSLVLAASMALLGTPAFAKDTTADVTVHSGPSEAVQAWRSALQAGDTRAIARMHGANTVVYGLDAPATRGDKAIMAGYDAMFSRYTAKVDIRDAGWIRQGPLLNSWGQFTLTLTPREGGEPVQVDGRFSDVAVWTRDHWQYVMDHASVPSH
ncbi:YybH family protein [Pseudomonas gingeri]|uniref:YybH family protein n=1 Tax=Pseudomonas gingeri TaxID=117681 RepID=UPI0015A0FB38|nr:nuclear transport factor 2 family protein [Pseudomonas gingeri]NWE46317.1 nuclear transport factor 2 family protein [Pseudomonas gingeri]